MKHRIWITFALLLVPCSLLLAQDDKKQQIPTKIFRLPPGKSHTIGGIQFMMLGWEELSAPEQTAKASRRIRVEFIAFNPPETRFEHRWLPSPGWLMRREIPMLSNTRMEALSDH